MMKINLLGQPTPAAKAVAAPGSSSRQALIFVVALAISMSIVGLLYYYWGHQITQEQAKLVHEQTRQKELAGVKAQNTLYQAQLEQLQARINTIQKLQSSRTGPVEMMVGLGNTVNQTSDLYLLAVQPEGGLLRIRGESDTVQAIARFIAALKNSPVFENVELRQYFQDDRETRRSFKFELSCSYKPPVPPQPEQTGGQGAARPTPATPTAGRRAGR